MLALLFLTTAPFPADKIAALESLVTVVNDPLETVVVAHTEKMLPENFNSNPQTPSVFISSRIDRKSGTASYFLHFDTAYNDYSARRYYRINYIGLDGATEQQIGSSKSSVEHCFRGASICSYREITVTQIPNSDFLAMANNPENTAPWDFKVSGKSGSDFRYFIIPAEAKALLNVTEKQIFVK